MPLAGVSGVVSRSIINASSNHSSSIRNGPHNQWNGVNGTSSSGREPLGVSAWQAADSKGSSSQNTSTSGAQHPSSQDYRLRQMSAHRRWLSRNKVGPSHSTSSIGKSTRKDIGDDITKMKAAFGQLTRAPYGRGPKYRETLGASVLLYMGVGMIAIGLVITFVGIGDHAFRTFELQMIGPTLVALGLVVCLVRVIICAFANKCDLCDRLIAEDEDMEAAYRRKSNVTYRASIQSWRPVSTRQLEATRLSTGPGLSVSNLYPPSPGAFTVQHSLHSVTPTPVHNFQKRHTKNAVDHHHHPASLPKIASESRSASLPDSLFSDSFPDEGGAVLSIESEDSSSSSSISEFQEVELHDILHNDQGENSDRAKIKPFEGSDAWRENKDYQKNGSEANHLDKGVVLNPSTLKT